MILILLIGLAFVALSFVLFLRVLLLPRMRRAEALQQIEGYGFAASAPGETLPTRKVQVPSLRESIDLFAGSLGALAAGRFKSANEDELRRLLRSAGYYTLPPRRFLGYQVLASVVLFGLFLLFALNGNRSPLVSILTVVVGVLGGWYLPLTFVRRRSRSRGERIDYDMPDLIDTLVATVEAGIAFSASLQIAAQRFRGPLGEELRLTLQEHRMGLALNEALTNMLERQNTKSIRAFVRSLIKGEELGVAVGQTLRNLAHEMRVLRRQLAEERAQKAPVKLVFPIVLFILPAIFLITLGPAVVRIHGIFR